MARLLLVDVPGCVELGLLWVGFDVSDVDLDAALACWPSAFKNRVVKRRCLVFETGCTAVVSCAYFRQAVQHCFVANKKDPGRPSLGLWPSRHLYGIPSVDGRIGSEEF